MKRHLVNGDAEMGSCAMDETVTSPTGWSFSGPISQLSYNSTVVVNQTYPTPEPR
jgi:hypothetical protein